MNATVSWDLPTTRESGNPLPVEEIEATEVSLSADQGANFGVLNNVLPPETSLLIPDLADGTWIVRLVVLDFNGRRSANVDTPFVVDSSPPGPAVNPSVAVSA
jgi:hypothetical protein